MIVRPFTFPHQHDGEDMSLHECSIRGLAGGLAGVLSWMVVYPVDIVKSILQTQDLRNPQYTTMMECGRHVLRTQGLVGLTRGLDATLLRAFPLNAVTFLGYEWALRKLHQWGMFKDEPVY
jgi:hypothetical protein